MAGQTSSKRRTIYTIVRAVLGVALIVCGLIYQSVIYRRNIPFQTFLVVTGTLLFLWAFAHRIPAEVQAVALAMVQANLS